MRVSARSVNHFHAQGEKPVTFFAGKVVGHLSGFSGELLALGEFGFHGVFGMMIFCEYKMRVLGRKLGTSRPLSRPRCPPPHPPTCRPSARQ
jgi:hypothetical protein